MDLIYLLGVALTLAICMFADTVARLLRVVDVPDGSRKRHSGQTPLVGGLAVLLPVLLVALGLSTSIQDAPFYLTLAGAMGALFVLGLIDDRKRIRPIWRLICSAALSVMVLRIFPEFEVRFLHFSVVEHSVRLGTWAAVFSVLCLVGLQNAVNMADGKNGLVLALSLVWGAMLFLYSPPGLQPILIIFLAAVAVALPFNLRGRLFLGDSGAYALSVLLGLLAIYVYNRGIRGPAADVVALWFLIPVVDCLRLIVVRILTGKSPFRGDANHLHHVLNHLMPWRWGLLVYVGFVAIPSLLAWAYPEATLGWAALALACYSAVFVSRPAPLARPHPIHREHDGHQGLGLS